MDNQEKLENQGTEDEENAQPREIGKIGYRRRRKCTIKRNWQDKVQKTKKMHNQETLARQGTEDEENAQSRETGKIGYIRRRKTKQKHRTKCVDQHYVQTNTNNVNKTCALLHNLVVKTNRTLSYVLLKTIFQTNK